MTRYQASLVLVVLAFWCVPVFAQEAGVVNVTAEGNATIYSNDVALAREEAIREALRRAIQNVASDLLAIPVRDKKFLPVKNEIMGQQDRYINNYKITAESRQGESYLVTVNVTVSLQDLRNDLAKIGFRQVSGTEKTNLILTLEVKGLKKYSDFLYLKEFLKKRARIVKHIHSQSYEWQKALLALEISGTAQAFAAELAKSGRYSVNNELVEKNQLAISLLPREGER